MKGISLWSGYAYGEGCNKYPTYDRMDDGFRSISKFSEQVALEINNLTKKLEYHIAATQMMQSKYISIIEHLEKKVESLYDKKIDIPKVYIKDEIVKIKQGRCPKCNRFLSKSNICKVHGNLQ